MKKKTINLMLLLLACNLSVQANDNYRQQASVPKVDSSGFYRILLTPEITTRMKRNAHDVRIFDQNETLVAFIFKEGSGLGEWQVLPLIHCEQDDTKSGISRFRIKSRSLKYSERIILNMDGPKYFYRDASIVALQQKKVRGRNKYREITLLNFQLSSDKKRIVLNSSSFNYDEVYLLITNGENPPLEVQSIEGKARSHYLLAWLEQGKEYHLKYGNPTLSRPNFDLQYFTSEIPAITRVLEPKAEKKRFEKIKSLVRSGLPLWAIWLTLLVVVVSLAMLSVRLIKNVDQQANTSSTKTLK